MDEPFTFDAMILRGEIDAGPRPGIAWVIWQRLRLFTVPVQVRLFGVRKKNGRLHSQAAERCCPERGK